MAQPIEQNTDYPCTVAELYGALTSEMYWKDRVSEFGLGSRVVEFFGVDGRTTSVVDQAVDAEMLPKALRRFAGADMSARCTEWWDPLVDQSASGGYELEVSRVPIVIAGDVTMTATSESTSRLIFVGTVTSTIPVMGPVVEKIMLGEVDKSFAAEKEFTLGWLNARH
ncbi:hypothetical protein GCM10007304_08090 [Rhodococcoides trifolii]|uniref:DUF2505 domain-containing protein n=1 Tax=Rhodococcoides trifolii TaxID=908250 RepID=A0A917CSR2_9NOCA|nr:DUF2505 domain-containing protein [Rhodococcus trifolii]GGF96503.1 hypothetical protein GCM10007304_08090 [Rhodococcus trifolii]